MRTLRIIQYLLLALGVLGIAAYLLARIHGTASSRAAIASFEALAQAPASEPAPKKLPKTGSVMPLV